jgi:hypothetical protein
VRAGVAVSVVGLLTGLAARKFLTYEPQPGQIALTHVTVIDCTGAPPQSDMTVVVTGHRIASVAKTGTFPLTADAQIVEGKGKYVIPGLWDLHVHISDQRSVLPLLVANGITGVRDMGGSLDVLQEWRRAIEAGSLLGPQIVAAGPFVDGPKPMWPNSIAVDSPAAARAAVQHLKSSGADFVKVYSLLPQPAYFEIAAESRRQRIPFAGHVPLSITVAQASDAGQLTVDHIPDILLSCSREEMRLREILRTAMGDPSLSPGDIAEIFFRLQVQSIDTYDREKAKVLFQRLAGNGTWLVPTLVVLQGRAEPGAVPPSQLDLMPARVRQGWDRALQNKVAAQADQRIFKKALEMIAAMHDKRVRLLAGTDIPAPYVVPGFSLHHELGLLVRAGLSPLQALQAATRNPAETLGVLDSNGTVERGKIANLVLLEANPLDDIANISRIAAVMLRGQLISKASLETIVSNRAREAERN